MKREKKKKRKNKNLNSANANFVRSPLDKLNLDVDGKYSLISFCKKEYLCNNFSDPK